MGHELRLVPVESEMALQPPGEQVEYGSVGLRGQLSYGEKHSGLICLSLPSLEGRDRPGQRSFLSSGTGAPVSISCLMI